MSDVTATMQLWLAREVGDVGMALAQARDGDTLALLWTGANAQDRQAIEGLAVVLGLDLDVMIGRVVYPITEVV